MTFKDEVGAIASAPGDDTNAVQAGAVAGPCEVEAADLSDSDGLESLVGAFAEEPAHSCQMPASSVAPIGPSANPVPVPCPLHVAEEAVSASPFAPFPANAEESVPNIVSFAVPKMPNGRLTWYKKKKQFFAYCGNRENHGARCRLTRTGNPPDYLRADWAGSGRPCGLLMAWIIFGSGLPSALAHSQFRPSLSQRIIGRALLKNYETGRSVLAWERAKELGEESENEHEP